MKATASLLAALVLAAAAVPAAHADNPLFPKCPQAPDMCGPGYYATNNCGALYGPNYCVRPAHPPFNGLLPAPGGGGPGGPGAGPGGPGVGPGGPGAPGGYPRFATMPGRNGRPVQVPLAPAGAAMYMRQQGGPGMQGQPGMQGRPGQQPSPPVAYQPGQQFPACAVPIFPTHPYARSPRDFFME
jgi:hypothetical protein